MKNPWLEPAQTIAQSLRGVRQDKAELVALLEKHKGKLPKADQALVETIKGRKHNK